MVLMHIAITSRMYIGENLITSPASESHNNELLCDCETPENHLELKLMCGMLEEVDMEKLQLNSLFIKK